MSVATVSRSPIRALQESSLASQGVSGDQRMYAIAFDMDTEALKQNYHADSYNNAYYDIRKLLTEKHGFAWQQGSVYFGGPKVNAVSCVLAAMDVAATFSWFAPSVRDIRMLRIEEQNDLMDAVMQAK